MVWLFGCLLCLDATCWKRCAALLKLEQANIVVGRLARVFRRIVAVVFVL